MSSERWRTEGDAVLAWLISHGFSGHDPFDGLESRRFARLPFARLPLARLAWLQLLKRLPLNLRRLLLVPQRVNPKTLGLVLTGLARRTRARGAVERALAQRLVKQLAGLRTPNSAGWGYPFAWQNRAFYAPLGTPNAVCSAFVVAGLMDYADAAGDAEAAALARSSFPFFAEELKHTPAPVGICFSYTPLDRTMIHNVNLLVAATVARLGMPGRDDAIELSTAALDFSRAAQRDDGSWPYGEGVGQGWVDSYHTGFNLGALRTLERLLKSDAAREARQSGYAYYRRALLTADALPKHYAHRFYPIDVHVAAQAIVTVLENADFEPRALELAQKTMRWAAASLGLGGGEYAYRRTRLGIIPIVYTRWGQAWMFRALCELE